MTEAAGFVIACALLGIAGVALVAGFEVSRRPGWFGPVLRHTLGRPPAQLGAAKMGLVVFLLTFTICGGAGALTAVMIGSA